MIIDQICRKSIPHRTDLRARTIAQLRCGLARIKSVQLFQNTEALELVNNEWFWIALGA